MNESIEFELPISEIITMLEKTDRIFVVHLKGTHGPDMKMLIFDDEGKEPYGGMITLKCWEDVQTEKILSKCTFSSKPGEIKHK